MNLRKITEEEKLAYREDGVVCLRDMFSDKWIDSLRQSAEDSLKSPGELHAELADAREENGRFFHDTFIWRRNEICRDYVFDSPAAHIAGKLMDSKKINIFFDQWLIKEPETETKTPWHHDLTYWTISGWQVCTLWLALDSVSAESGAVEYVKGSHLWNKKFKPASFSGNNQYKEALPEVPDIEAMRDELEFIKFDLEPGDCTIHHGLTVHGSPGNKSSSKRRRAHVSRWAGDDVIFHPREGLQEMPPLPDLNDGDPIDSELFPKILG